MTIKAASDDKVRKSFSKLREEMDDQRETLNQLTSELEGVYDWIFQFEQSLQKISEGVAEKQVARQADVVNLTLREQELFVLLYLTQEPLHLTSIADRLGFQELVVQEYADRLMMKGVPVLRQPTSEGLFYSMELKFKERQAKEHLVEIDPRISQELLPEKRV